MDLIQVHFSDSWAMILKTFLEDEQLTNGEIAVTDASGNDLPMQVGVGAELGELKDVPAPYSFPLSVRKTISQAGSSQSIVWPFGHLVSQSTG